MVTDMRLTTNKIYRPIKKKSGVIAGIARAGGGRDSSVGYGAMDSNEEVRKPPLRVMSGLLCFLCWQNQAISISSLTSYGYLL